METLQEKIDKEKKGCRCNDSVWWVSEWLHNHCYFAKFSNWREFSSIEIYVKKINQMLNFFSWATLKIWWKSREPHKQTQPTSCFEYENKIRRRVPSARNQPCFPVQYVKVNNSLQLTGFYNNDSMSLFSGKYSGTSCFRAKRMAHPSRIALHLQCTSPKKWHWDVFLCEHFPSYYFHNPLSF